VEPRPDRLKQRPEQSGQDTDRSYSIEQDLLSSLAEREVFFKVAAGASNAEVAAALHMSEGTVKVHVGRILAKFDLRDRVQIVVLGYESGLITPSG